MAKYKPKIIAHPRSTLEYVSEKFSHTHGVNPDGHRICIACMATILLQINDTVMKDASLMPDGKIVFTKGASNG